MPTRFRSASTTLTATPGPFFITQMLPAVVPAQATPRTTEAAPSVPIQLTREGRRRRGPPGSSRGSRSSAAGGGHRPPSTSHRCRRGSPPATRTGRGRRAGCCRQGQQPQGGTVNFNEGAKNRSVNVDAIMATSSARLRHAEAPVPTHGTGPALRTPAGHSGKAPTIQAAIVHPCRQAVARQGLPSTQRRVMLEGTRAWGGNSC